MKVLKLFLFLIIICVTSVAKAQFYDTGIYYYIKDYSVNSNGEKMKETDHRWVKVIYIERDKVYARMNEDRNKLYNTLKQDENYYLNLYSTRLKSEKKWIGYKGTVNHSILDSDCVFDGWYQYSPELSTSSRYTYKSCRCETRSTFPVYLTMLTGNILDFEDCFSFSNDKSSFFEWKTSDNGTIRYYYKRVMPYDLAPNMDFLNE